MAKDILKEAIADAKAVREVALANAKAALEEAFTPKLQSMLSAKLSETLDEKEELDEMGMYDETAKEDDMSEASHEEKDDTNEELEEIDLEEILAELELEEADEADDNKVDEAKDEDLDEAKDKDLDEAKDEDLDEVKDKDLDEAKDKDLDEAKDEDLDEAKDDKEKDLEEYHSMNPQASDVSKVDYGAKVSESEEFDLDSLLEEINNLEEKDEAEDVKEYGGFNVKPGQSGGTDDTYKAMKAAAEGASDLSDFLNAIMDIPGAMGLLKNPKVLQNWADQIKFTQESVSVDEVQAELEETQKALEAVRGELNEVNLLNSKLLYVNRIFKANHLDEGQKLRVVETLDKAESAKEAKLIYETIKDTFNVAKSKKASISKKQTRTLKEGLGMASKAAGTSTAPKKEIISESKDMVSRFQKLANIKINE